MKKVLISVGVVAIFVIYAVYQHFHTAPANIPDAVTQTQTDQPAVSQNPPSSTPPTSASPSTPVIASPKPSGQYKDGQYTGIVADAFYGKLQVVAIVSGGKLTDVQVPVYPTDRGHTLEVSQESLPVLKSEAIAKQSSDVDIVSGATQTSEAFRQSLQSALSQAKS